MANTNLSTTAYRLQNAFNLLNEISTTNNYYFFAGSYLPQANVTLQPLYDITSNTLTQCWTNMIMGKQLNSGDVFSMINNNLWMANTIYAQYDDQDANLPQEQFFAITSEGSFHHVWKCLDNNSNSESIIQPLFIHANSTPYYQTSDGYRWLYLTSMENAIVQQFQTSNYFPIQPNNSVTTAAIPGALETFVLESNGAFYNNYITGTFVASDIAINGDPTLFNISNNVVNAVNGFYTGCLLYLNSGPGQGQYATITNFVSNTTGNILQIGSPFVTTPQNGTTFQINPQLTIVSDGAQTVNCVARALVNSLSSNSIYSIEPIETGENYFNIISASIIANVVVGITNNAIIRVVSAPPGGHGSNIYSELYCNSIGISIALSNNENNTIPTTNDYQQIGLLDSPLFTNVVANFISTNGTFITGESAYSIEIQQLDANCVSNVGNTTITSSVLSPNAQVISLASITVTGGSGYSNTDNIVVSNSTYVNATASITTNSTGGFQNSGIIITNVGLFNSPNTALANIAVANSTGGVSTGSGASLTIALNTATFQNFVSVPGSANFINQFAANDWIFITSGHGTYGQLTQVNSVVNSTVMTITSPALFSCTAVIVYAANLTGNCFVTAGGTTQITITNCTPNFTSGTILAGQTYGAYGSISSLTRNGSTKFLNTFVELYKYNATLVSGTFQQNEEILQGNNTGYLFYANGTSGTIMMYMSNFNGGPFSNGTITGANSGAVASVTAEYSPEVLFGSADILYLENISPVTRENTQTETFQLILNF